MTKDKALKTALVALGEPDHPRFIWRRLEAILAIKKALKQPKSVQVSPLEFVTRVAGKEEAIGEPTFWAQWPNKEKNA